jgi:hypothetical protein
MTNRLLALKGTGGVRLSPGCSPSMDGVDCGLSSTLPETKRSLSRLVFARRRMTGPAVRLLHPLPASETAVFQG